ncbi:MAG: 50S ribosomal protein L25 [Planctomycetota bacterium]
MKRVVIQGQVRDTGGSRAAYRLRKQGWIPANLYGHGLDNVHFQIRAEEISKALYDGHHMITLEMDGSEGTGLVKEIQFDAMGEKILHVDFARVDLEEIIETTVTMELFGNPKGLAAGGILEVPHHELMVRGRARDIPESIRLEVGELLISDSIRVRDVNFPEGVEALLDAEEPVVIIQLPRGTEVAEKEAEEPEIIDESKKEEKKEPE